MIRNWFNKTFELQNKIMGMNQRNFELINKLNPRPYHKLANDKVLSKLIFEEHGIPSPKVYAIIESMGDIHKAWAKMDDQSEVAIKPAQGSQGGGILILKKNKAGEWVKGSGKPMSLQAIHNHLANIIFGLYSNGRSDRAIIEYCLHSHHFFLDIFPEGVADLRIIMFKDMPVMAMLRLPTNQSDGKANLHQGALGVGIELDTGKLMPGFHHDRYVSEHPDTAVNFEGQTVPFWQDILEICRKTSRSTPLKYLGIDVVIDEEQGPLVLEINARPGLAIQNANRRGLFEAIEQLPQQLN